MSAFAHIGFAAKPHIWLSCWPRRWLRRMRLMPATRRRPPLHHGRTDRRTDRRFVQDRHLQARLAAAAFHSASALHRLFRGDEDRPHPGCVETQAQGNLDGPAGGRSVAAEKFNPKDLPFQLLGPYGMAVDSKGRLYVADQRVGAVFIFNTETRDVELIANGQQATSD